MEVNISYELLRSGNYTKNSVKQVSEIAERLKRLLYNNKVYDVSGSNKYFNGSVESIIYERDEDNDELLRAITSFTCQTLEIV